MLELGADEQRWHRDTGAAEGRDLLVCVGRLGRVLGEGAVEAGLSAGAIRHAASAEEGVLWLESSLPATWCFKTSRAIGLERAGHWRLGSA